MIGKACGTGGANQAITHPQQPPACASSPFGPAGRPASAPGAPEFEIRLTRRETPRRDFFFRFASSSEGGAYGRMERCTMVGVTTSGGWEITKLSFASVSSSCNIFPRYNIRIYDGAGGCWSSCQSVGHAFHINSFTRPMVVSGSKDMVRRRPVTSRNVR